MVYAQTPFTDILIIGNGFDLNLGLKTSYNDFIKSSFFSGLVADNNSLARYLQSKQTLQNWIDIEIELKKFSLDFHNEFPNNNFEQEYYSLSNALMKYISKIDYNSININSSAYELIDNIKQEDFLILDFNYTRSIQTILNQLGVKSINIGERLIKVHGSAEQNYIIFGVEDEADINPNHIFLKKGYNKNFKSINLNHYFSNVIRTYIFGHSLGETDHMYFKSYFQGLSIERPIKEMNKIYLFYYGEECYKQIHIQLDNLTETRLSRLKTYNDFKAIETKK
jgi:hypothetical protein